MFGVKHNECVGFDSRWEVKKVYYEGCTQTPLYVSKNATTETARSKEIEVQTDPMEIPQVPAVDMDKLAGFLTKIYPKVIEELDESVNSTAFAGYKVQNEPLEEASKLLQTIEVFPQNESTETVNSAKISSVSWNCSARTIAVAMSYPHQSWCYDSGVILVYFLDREERIPSSPSRKISSDSCITNIQFHPLMPAILAGSAHDGTILIWNVQDVNNDSVLSKISRTDNVSCMNWMTLDHVTMDIVFLVTGCLDGTITMWRFNNSYTCANVYEKYKIKPPVMSRIKRSKSRRSANSVEIGVGVTCFEFSRHLPDMFVVGTEGGLVIQCSTSKPIKLKGGTETDPLYDPVFQHYDPHDGAVVNVQVSRTRNDMFLTTGADLQTRIYIIGQEEPARVIFFNSSVNPHYWVPYEKHLIYGYGMHKNIEVYNVKTGKIVDRRDIAEKSRPLFTNAVCEINPKKPNIVAVGIKEGVLELWMISWGTYANITD
ncbi:hypothetical protein WA026_023397 [Henosepilachna vigintioctopunctata]|uniref:Dynein axonemal intermediate chain 4 n=1 Tax=Henosepilachna vigintioctopunctata TaxID=420089 RepID=A0AAW1U4Q8_9CUCU